MYKTTKRNISEALVTLRPDGVKSGMLYLVTGATPCMKKAARLSLTHLKVVHVTCMMHDALHRSCGTIHVLYANVD
jgi:hypothetical protein